MFVANGTGVLKKVLVSRPEFLKPAPINEIAKKWKDTTMDVEKMPREHDAFVEAYRNVGVEGEFLEVDIERPNSVFARDFGGCVKEGYVMGNFKRRCAIKNIQTMNAAWRNLACRRLQKSKRDCLREVILPSSMSTGLQSAWHTCIWICALIW